MSTIVEETVEPYKDQQCGTSGLRRKVVVFEEGSYLANFIQSYFNVSNLAGQIIVVSGDGRYFTKQAVAKILAIAQAAAVKRVIMGRDFMMSTPCVSAVIIERKAIGGIILTASHNPGGPNNDFGVKFNCANGGPAPLKLTDAIYEETKVIKSCRLQSQPAEFDASVAGEYKYQDMVIEVINAPQAYADLMATIFDFDGLKQLIGRSDFSLVYDAMHGVAGPFAREIFVNRLGAPESVLLNAEPKEDFGGLHPDPNLSHAHDLTHRMAVDCFGNAVISDEKQSDIPDFGAAADGDADRNMILGKQFFVTPSDSLAIICANCVDCIPYFAKHGLKGVARSMPTSAAVDKVAAKLKIKCYEVPTGWKFFGNLMDAGLINLCGEESFGTGSDHIREKDGIWAVLAWLSILQKKNKHSNCGELVSVKQIVHDHWRKFGRNFYCRYDYEEVTAANADKMMKDMTDRIANGKIADDIKQSATSTDYELASADEFSYFDPVDKTTTARQGIRFLFKDGSRFMFRLSGTGSVGATIRLYLEKYVAEPSDRDLEKDSLSVLASLVDLALSISKLEKYTGRTEPSVIT